MSFWKSLFGGVDESEEAAAKAQLEKDFDTLKYDGMRALQMGQPAQAATFLEAARERKAEDATVVKWLVQAYLNTGRTEEARELLQDVLRLEDIELMLLLAHVDYMLKEYDEMAEICRKVLAIAPENAAAHHQLALAAAATEDMLTAVVEATQAVTLAPEDAENYLTRARILADMGQWAEAEADANYLLAQFDVTEESLWLKAALRRAQGAAAEAIPYYIRMKDLNPFAERAYVAMSEAYAECRQRDASLKTLEEGLELLPESGALYKERGRIRMELGDKAGAMEDVKRAMELLPEEARRVEGAFTNIAAETEARYKQMNPYGF